MASCRAQTAASSLQFDHKGYCTGGDTSQHQSSFPHRPVASHYRVESPLAPPGPAHATEAAPGFSHLASPGPVPAGLPRRNPKSGPRSAAASWKRHIREKRGDGVCPQRSTQRIRNIGDVVRSRRRNSPGSPVARSHAAETAHQQRHVHDQGRNTRLGGYLRVGVMSALPAPRLPASVSSPAVYAPNWPMPQPIIGCSIVTCRLLRNSAFLAKVSRPRLPEPRLPGPRDGCRWWPRRSRRWSRSGAPARPGAAPRRPRPEPPPREPSGPSPAARPSGTRKER